MASQFYYEHENKKFLIHSESELIQYWHHTFGLPTSFFPPTHATGKNTWFETYCLLPSKQLYSKLALITPNLEKNAVFSLQEKDTLILNQLAGEIVFLLIERNKEKSKKRQEKKWVVFTLNIKTVHLEENQHVAEFKQRLEQALLKLDAIEISIILMGGSYHESDVEIQNKILAQTFEMVKKTPFAAKFSCLFTGNKNKLTPKTKGRLKSHFPEFIAHHTKNDEAHVLQHFLFQIKEEKIFLLSEQDFLNLKKNIHSDPFIRFYEEKILTHQFTLPFLQEDDPVYKIYHFLWYLKENIKILMFYMQNLKKEPDFLDYTVKMEQYTKSLIHHDLAISFAKNDNWVSALESLHQIEKLGKFFNAIFPEIKAQEMLSIFSLDLYYAKNNLKTIGASISNLIEALIKVEEAIFYSPFCLNWIQKWEPIMDAWLESKNVSVHSYLLLVETILKQARLHLFELAYHELLGYAPLFKKALQDTKSYQNGETINDLDRAIDHVQSLMLVDFSLDALKKIFEKAKKIDSVFQKLWACYHIQFELLLLNSVFKCLYRVLNPAGAAYFMGVTEIEKIKELVDLFMEILPMKEFYQWIGKFPGVFKELFCFAFLYYFLFLKEEKSKIDNHILKLREAQSEESFLTLKILEMHAQTLLVKLKKTQHLFVLILFSLYPEWGSASAFGEEYRLIKEPIFYFYFQVKINQYIDEQKIYEGIALCEHFFKKVDESVWGDSEVHSVALLNMLFVRHMQLALNLISGQLENVQSDIRKWRINTDTLNENHLVMRFLQNYQIHYKKLKSHFWICQAQIANMTFGNKILFGNILYLLQFSFLTYQAISKVCLELLNDQLSIHYQETKRELYLKILSVFNKMQKHEQETKKWYGDYFTMLTTPAPKITLDGQDEDQNEKIEDLLLEVQEKLEEKESRIFHVHTDFIEESESSKQKKSYHTPLLLHHKKKKVKKEQGTENEMTSSTQIVLQNSASERREEDPESKAEKESSTLSSHSLSNLNTTSYLISQIEKLYDLFLNQGESPKAILTQLNHFSDAILQAPLLEQAYYYRILIEIECAQFKQRQQAETLFLVKPIFKLIHQCFKLIKNILTPVNLDSHYSLVDPHQLNHTLLIQDELIFQAAHFFKACNTLSYSLYDGKFVVLPQEISIYHKEAWEVIFQIIHSGYQILLRGGVVREAFLHHMLSLPAFLSQEAYLKSGDYDFITTMPISVFKQTFTNFYCPLKESSQATSFFIQLDVSGMKFDFYFTESLQSPSFSQDTLIHFMKNADFNMNSALYNPFTAQIYFLPFAYSSVLNKKIKLIEKIKEDTKITNFSLIIRGLRFNAQLTPFGFSIDKFFSLLLEKTSKKVEGQTKDYFFNLYQSEQKNDFLTSHFKHLYSQTLKALSNGRAQEFIRLFFSYGFVYFFPFNQEEGGVIARVLDLLYAKNYLSIAESTQAILFARKHELLALLIAPFLDRAYQGNLSREAILIFIKEVIQPQAFFLKLIPSAAFDVVLSFFENKKGQFSFFNTLCQLILERVTRYLHYLFKHETPFSSEKMILPNDSQLFITIKKLSFFSIPQPESNSSEAWIACLEKLPILDPITRAIPEFYLVQEYESKGNYFSLFTVLKRLISILTDCHDDVAVTFFSKKQEALLNSSFADSLTATRTSTTHPSGSYFEGRFFKQSKGIKQSKSAVNEAFAINLLTYFVSKSE